MQLIKKITGIVLLVALTCKILMAPIIFANYELRKEFIIKNFCVNKNRPILHCDGKCYLAKQIKTAEQQDEKQATASFISKLLSFEAENKNNLFLNYFTKKAAQAKETPDFIYTILPTSKLIFSFFHPPRV